MVQYVQTGFKKTYSIAFEDTPAAGTNAAIQIQGAAGIRTRVTRIFMATAASCAFAFQTHTATAAAGTAVTPRPSDPNDGPCFSTVQKKMAGAPGGSPVLLRTYTTPLVILVLDSMVEFANGKGITAVGTSQFISIIASVATPTVGWVEFTEEPVP